MMKRSGGVRVITFIKTLIIKNKSLIIYLLCSVIAALIESVIGWTLLHLLSLHITIINTMAILFGAVVHYFLTSIFVFKVKRNVTSAGIYFVSFGMGILLQNVVIWLFYDFVLVSATGGLRFAISKGASLAIPFLVVYWVRKKLNERYARKEKCKDE